MNIEDASNPKRERRATRITTQHEEGGISFFIHTTQEDETELHTGSIFVAECTLEASEVPQTLDVYYLASFDVDFEHQDLGYGSELLDFVTNFLKSSGKIAYLHNHITEDEKQAMYEKKGWTYLSGKSEKTMVFVPDESLQPQVHDLRVLLELQDEKGLE